MSETLYSDIRAALTAHLQTMQGIPDVAWENIDYAPIAGSPYLAPTILWAEGSQAEIGETGRNWERGIYQITCSYPTNQGSGPLNVMLGKLRERFKRGTRLVYNGVTVTVRKVYPGPNGIISIAFYCQAAN